MSAVMVQNLTVAVAQAIKRVEDASHACGAWDSSSYEPYEAAYERAEKAKQDLQVAILGMVEDHVHAAVTARNASMRAGDPEPAVESVQAMQDRVRRTSPLNVGKPWSEQEDAALLASTLDFTDRGNIARVADLLGRTRFGIEQRLIRLGRLMPCGERRA